MEEIITDMVGLVNPQASSCGCNNFLIVGELV